MPRYPSPSRLVNHALHSEPNLLPLIYSLVMTNASCFSSVVMLGLETLLWVGNFGTSVMFSTYRFCTCVFKLCMRVMLHLCSFACLKHPSLMCLFFSLAQHCIVTYGVRLGQRASVLLLFSELFCVGHVLSITLWV